jgi:xylan 1,4-beta-xylosidase
MLGAMVSSAALVLPLVLAAGEAAPPPAVLPDPAPPGSPRELVDLLNLPRLRPWKALQASGYDRGGGFYDSGNFLRVDPDGSWVLLDARGAGSIDRIWTTAKRDLEVDWIVEVDGAVWLRADREALFPSSAEARPAHPELRPPLAGRSTPLACHSYVPIPFRRSARIAVRPRRPLEERDLRTNSKGERIPHLYYQIGYRLFPEGLLPAALSPGDRSRALEEVAAAWRRHWLPDPAAARDLDADPGPPAGAEGWSRAAGEATAAPGAETTLLRLEGPGLAACIALSAPGLAPGDRSRLRLRIAVDGEAAPGIDAPADGYFAVGASELPVRGILAGGRKDAFYSRMPVPFRRSAAISVRNETGAERKVSIDVVHGRFAALPPDFGFLRAKEYSFADAPKGEDLVLLEVSGVPGHLVGTALIDAGDMEGDERISVDGGPVSDYHGTGTEDYLNFAWGLGYRGSFPLHGMSASADARGRHANGYRFGLADVVSWRRSIRFTFEHGHASEDRGRYRGVVFWYEMRDAPLPLRKLLDMPLRDTSICRGSGGAWYMTGTVEPFWGFNEGIRLWRSKDLVAWEPLGMVWKYGASPWHAKFLEAKKPLWAPEVHCMKGTFWLTYSMPGWDGTARTSGSGLLRSVSGRPEGPYEDVQPAERLGDEIDASLFEDDDGTVYFLWHSGKITRMKPDLSGLAEPYRWLRTTSSDPDPRHHSGLCSGIFGPGSFDHVGYEGMTLFKAGGRYHLACAEQFDGRYSCTIASSDHIFGPYGPRYEALPHAGHNTFFRDDGGQWWSTYFGSDPGAPWQERPGIFPVEFGSDGRLRPKSP